MRIDNATAHLGRTGSDAAAEAALTVDVGSLELGMLSEDLLARIFEFVDPHELHKSVAPVCRQ